MITDQKLRALYHEFYQNMLNDRESMKEAKKEMDKSFHRDMGTYILDAMSHSEYAGRIKATADILTRLYELYTDND